MLRALPEGPAAAAGQRQDDQRACRPASDCGAGIVIEGECAVPVTRIGRPLPRCDKPSNERLDLCCRVSIREMRENGPESAPEGHGRAPRTELLSYLQVSRDKQGASGLDPEAQQEA